jgi:multicomponent Na+:H+ antiporter subunit G
VSAWLAAALVIAGATFALLAGVGVLRMPDVFTRMQASTKASTLGLGCLLAGVALLNPEFSFVIRAISLAAFMLLTTAVAAHVIARAAAISGAPLWTGTRVDERPHAPPLVAANMGDRSSRLARPKLRDERHDAGAEQQGGQQS